MGRRIMGVYVMYNKILARRLFHSLVKGYYRSEYLVLNDCNYYATIWADSEEEAINIFMNGGYKHE